MENIYSSGVLGKLKKFEVERQQNQNAISTLAALLNVGSSVYTGIKGNLAEEQRIDEYNKSMIESGREELTYEKKSSDPSIWNLFNLGDTLFGSDYVRSGGSDIVDRASIMADVEYAMMNRGMTRKRDSQPIFNNVKKETYNIPTNDYFGLLNRSPEMR